MGIIVENGVVSASRASRSHQKPSGSEADLIERIAKLLSEWNGLQMAVRNQWGGRDSLQKYHLLAADIFSMFSQYKGFSVEDIENLLHENLLLSFNTEIEDGSIEEVAEQLIVMHEEYLQESH